MLLPEACAVLEDVAFCRDKAICDSICASSLCTWLEPDHFFNLLMLAKRYGSTNIVRPLSEFRNLYGSACRYRALSNETFDLVKGHSAKKYFSVPTCQDSCTFGCFPAEPDEWERNQLEHKGIPELKLFECAAFPNWLLISASIALITVFFGIFIVFFVCSPRKTDNIYAVMEGPKEDEMPSMEIPVVVVEPPPDSGI
ncbi:hypothetical protein QR680_012539 [Steinernema hermaphroditum]|uniref:Uncharacterized protein n=1 Tax=Steinernema hermaphroditum TaxID=289476 RepID=A0AA39LZZ5_9BILA|nr:hypothetical protein QR680_012539 [Steinernema hermaphroditum]